MLCYPESFEQPAHLDRLRQFSSVAMDGTLVGGNLVSLSAVRTCRLAQDRKSFCSLMIPAVRLRDREAERAKNIDTVCYQCPPRDRIL
jgi:hypothetical protein